MIVYRCHGQRCVHDRVDVACTHVQGLSLFTDLLGSDQLQATDFNNRTTMLHMYYNWWASNSVQREWLTWTRKQICYLSNEDYLSKIVALGLNFTCCRNTVVTVDKCFFACLCPFQIVYAFIQYFF